VVDVDLSLGTVLSAQDASESQLAAEMMAGMAPGKSNNPLRVSLKAARQQQSAIELASARLFAAMAGTYSFHEKQVGMMGSGRSVTIIEVRWTRDGKDQSEVIPNWPVQVVSGIVGVTLQDTDATVRSNIKPHNMACVSPRMFWSIVRHGQVGPNKTFEAALKQLVPDQDWAVLLSRTQEELQEGKYRY